MRLDRYTLSGIEAAPLSPRVSYAMLVESKRYGKVVDNENIHGGKQKVRCYYSTWKSRKPGFFATVVSEMESGQPSIEFFPSSKVNALDAQNDP